MKIPLLNDINPNSYPMSAVDWREPENYSDHGEDAPFWAWEFVRRRRDFQLLTDIRDATHLAQSNGCTFIGEESDNIDVISEMHQRASKIRKLRLTDQIVAVLQQFPSFSEELIRAKEKGYLTENHEYKLGFGHVVARFELSRIFPQFREPAGWRNLNPWPEIPGMKRPKILNPEIHRHQMPPWPVKWHGDDLVDENDLRMSVAYMESTSIEAYTPMGKIYVETDDDSGEFKLPNENDENLRALYNQAVGSVVDFGKRAEYRYLTGEDKQKASHMAHIAFDLSAPIQTQLAWADEYLSAMRERAIAAGIMSQENKAEDLPGHLGINRLRYLDYSSDPLKCTGAEFQRMLGWKGGDSTKWRRLRESALKYRDEIGSKLCDYRKPLTKRDT